MKIAIVLVLTFVVVAHGTFLDRRDTYRPFRPTRWVPRAFWHPEKKSINSLGGYRPYGVGSRSAGFDKKSINSLGGFRPHYYSRNHNLDKKMVPMIEDEYMEPDDVMSNEMLAGQGMVDEGSFLERK